MRVGMTGHQDIPKEAIQHVVHQIRSTLSSQHELIMGLTSLAVGADQIFAREVLEAGGGLIVVIPCANYESTFKNKGELEEYRSLVAQANEVIELSHMEPSEVAFFDAGRRIVDTSDLLLAVWDGEEARGKGGTADIVEYAGKKGVPVNIIWPSNTQR